MEGKWDDEYFVAKLVSVRQLARQSVDQSVFGMTRNTGSWGKGGSGNEREGRDEAAGINEVHLCRVSVYLSKFV